MKNYQNKSLKYVIMALIVCLAVYLIPNIYNNFFKENQPQKYLKPEPSQQQPSPKSIKPSSKTVRFVVLSDSRGSENGVNSKVVTKTMQQIRNLSPQPQFAVIPGDLIGGGKTYPTVKGQLAYFKKLVTKYYPSGFFYPGIGNHEVSFKVNGEKALSEVFGTFKATFLKGYGRSVYYFDRGNTRLFMLNTYHPGFDRSLADGQLNWVKSNILPDRKHNLFFFHAPAYPTGPHIGSSLDTYPMTRNKLWQIIDASNGPLVFCGHEHFYSRKHINSAYNQSIKGKNFRYKKSIYQVTVGSFGAPIYKKYSKQTNLDVAPVTQYHYAVVDIQDSGVQVTVYNLDGKIIDKFKIS